MITRNVQNLKPVQLANAQVSWLVHFTRFVHTEKRHVYYWKSGNFRENFIFANSVKRHICDVKSSRVWHDIPISVNGRVIYLLHEGFIFKKLRMCEVS